MRIEGISLQIAGTATSNTMTTSVAEEAGNASSVGDNRACSDGGSGKDRYSDDMLLAESREYTKKPLHYGCGQEGE